MYILITFIAIVILAAFITIDNDLDAIYAYLKSTKRVYNPVVKFSRQSLKKLITSDEAE
jgi:hypothetical protein